MDKPTGRPSLVLPITTYRDYFARDKTNTFCIHYTVVPRPCNIYVENTSANTSLSEDTRQIYAASQESVSHAFLKWHRRSGIGRAQIAPLHLMSSYVPQMGNTTSPWYDLYFALKGEFMCGKIMCANWLVASLCQIVTAIHFPTLQDKDAVLASEPELDLLGLFAVDNADAKAIQVHKTIYVPAPFMGILLDRDLTPVEV